MAVFEESMLLPATPERAFAIVGDPANGPAIDPMIKRYEPEGGAMREGGMNHIRARMFGLPMRIVSVTREWDPPRRMVMENVRPRGPVRMTLTQTFEPHPDGTRLTYRADITGFGPAAALFRWFIARNARRAMPRLMELTRRSAG